MEDFVTIQIAPLAALLIVVGFAVGFSVFKHTARSTHGAVGRGDLGTSIGAAAAVVTVLALLLTPGFGQTPTPLPSPANPGSTLPTR
ncbi:hypothetical protein ACFWTC_38670 [Streptomyces sp. NPDC058619]|uniref:hypothetical protein n=1 Tax=unclassified Streptomyces TaxID=2593676 RepID=UPI00364A614C